MSPQKIIKDSIETLHSGAKALELLSNNQYSRVHNPYFTSSIGKHYRHIIYYYLSFIQGLPKQHVNYDQRDRKTNIEKKLTIGQQFIQKVIDGLTVIAQQLEQGAFSSQPLAVTLSTSTSLANTQPVPSSIERELVFLQSHTTHHYAIIAAIMKLSKIEVDACFGVSPSTLVYQELSQCAQQAG